MILWSLVAQAALTWCTLQNVPVDFRGRNTFHCSSGNSKFVALCDLPIDQVELKAHQKEYGSGKWLKAGQDQGIDFKAGYIACEQKTEPKKPASDPVKGKKGQR